MQLREIQEHKNAWIFNVSKIMRVYCHEYIYNTTAAASTRVVLHVRNVQKTDIQFKFGFKNLTVQKFDTSSDGFPIETVCNPPIK